MGGIAWEKEGLVLDCNDETLTFILEIKLQAHIVWNIKDFCDMILNILKLLWTKCYFEW